MSDRSAASAGFVLAGLALAAAFLPWGVPTVGVSPVESIVGAALAAAAVGAFAARRHGALDRHVGSLLAGVASLAVAGYALAALLSGLDAGNGGAGTGLGLAFATGLGGVAAAYGDRRAIPRARLLEMASATSTASLIGIAGIVAIVVWVNVLALALTAVGVSLTTIVSNLLSPLALGIGTATVAAGFLRLTDRDWSYVDFELPDLRDTAYIVGGVVALLACMQGLTLLFRQFGVETAQHSIEQTARQGDPTVLLLLIPAAWLLIGPGEELLYRNIVQKSLYESFSPLAAVLVGSAIFSLVHIPVYASGASTLTALLSTLAVIVALSLILGFTYLKTENTTVPAVIHGTYDALAFGSLYFSIAGAPAWLHAVVP